MQAIRYHRFSSRRQDKGSSIERQNENTLALCEAKGWTIVETLEDRGQSAWKGDHLSVGNLGKLRKRIDAGLIPAQTRIVVENLDRLSRQDYRTARRWIEDVTDRGIVVAVCTPAMILDAEAMNGSNIGAMLQHLLEANRATGESARKSEFQKRNIARMLDEVRSGTCPSPRVPSWLIGEVGKPIAVNKERAEVVNLIYEWSACGLGMQSICKKLNATIEPWTKPGWKKGAIQWRIGYVRDILNSPIVEGKYVVKAGEGREPTGEIIIGYYPRIVDSDLVIRARAARAGRNRTGGAKAGEALNYFVGLATCKFCDGYVGRVAMNGYGYMICRNSRYGTCHNKAGMPNTVLEKVVVDQLLHLALDDTHFASVDSAAPIVARVSESKNTLSRLFDEQSNLIGMVRRLPDSSGLIDELGKIDAEISAAQIALIEAENALTRARGQVSPDEHLKRVASVRDKLDTEAEARRMVRDALSSIITKMVWDGETMAVQSPHFFLTINKKGTIGGFDLFHPRAGAASYPDFARRRVAAHEAGLYLPIVGK